MPTGTISRVCGAAGCQGEHSGSAPLALAVSLPPQFAAASVAWSRADGVAIPAGSAIPNGLVLPAASLPAGGAPLTVVATLRLAGEVGVASSTVYINAPPYCAAPAAAPAANATAGDGTVALGEGAGGNAGCVAISVQGNASAYPAEFVVTASSFADDDDGAAG